MKKVSLIIILCMVMTSLIPVYAANEPSNINGMYTGRDHGQFNNDVDTDKDLLTDYQEKYKYYTDPNKADSDGDGIPDGDWNERSEYTYTIKAHLQIVGPWDINSMNNDYQDARIIEVKDNYVECEIVFYTENNIKESIRGNKEWGNYGPEFDEYLKSYAYANWDEQMKKDLIKELNAYGIYPENLSDKELVQKVSIWISNTTKIVDHLSPAQFYLKFDDNGRLYVDEKYRNTFEQRVKQGRAVSDDEIINTQVLGKQMYYNKTRSGCTSSATYASTIYRALGIPTRQIHSTRLTEGVLKFINNIKNPIVKEILIETSEMKGGHQTNEVYIDGRWVRIDYEEFGADNIAQGRGLKYQNITINDYSDIDMVECYAKILAEDPLDSKDTYKLLDLSDTYGKHYKPNHRYGIDTNAYDTFLTFGEKDFSAIARATVIADLEKYVKLNRGGSRSISGFKDEYLDDNNILIISAKTPYQELPSKIRAKISRTEYSGLSIDEYRTIVMNKAIVLIIRK